MGSKQIVELKPGGAAIPLTNTNRSEYVDLFVRWQLEDSVLNQYRPFEDGFYLVAGSDALQMFEAEELELVICGSPEVPTA